MSLAYDAIVVGAGSCGSIIASRLAATGVTVALVEQGGFQPLQPASHMDTDPRHEHIFSLQAQEPQPHSVVRAHTVGGCATINGSYFHPPEQSPYPQLGSWWAARDFDADYRAACTLVGVQTASATTRLSRHVLSASASARLLAVNCEGTQRSTAATWFPDIFVQSCEHGQPKAMCRGCGLIDLWPHSVVESVQISHGAVNSVRLACGEEIRSERVFLCASTLGTLAILHRSGILPASLDVVEHPELLFHVPPQLQQGGKSRDHLLEVIDRKSLGNHWAELRPYTADFSHFMPHLPRSHHLLGVGLLNPAGQGKIHVANGNISVELPGFFHPQDQGFSLKASRLVGQVCALDEIPAAIATTHSQHLYSCAQLRQRVDEHFNVTEAAGLRVMDSSVLPPTLLGGPHSVLVAMALAIPL